jgi:hypothetical protein
MEARETQNFVGETFLTRCILKGKQKEQTNNMRLKGNNLEDNGMYKTVLRIYS